MTIGCATRPLLSSPDTTTPTVSREAAGAAGLSSTWLGFDGLVLFVFGVDGMVVGVVFDIAMMFGVNLARVFGVLSGVGGMAGRDMRMMPCRLGVTCLMVDGGFTVMLGRQLVMVGRVVMMFVGVMSGGHFNILSGLGAKPTGSRSQRDGKPITKTKVRRLDQGFVTVDQITVTAFDQNPETTKNKFGYSSVF